MGKGSYVNILVSVCIAKYKLYRMCVVKSWFCKQNEMHSVLGGLDGMIPVRFGRYDFGWMAGLKWYLMKSCSCFKFQCDDQTPIMSASGDSAWDKFLQVFGANLAAAEHDQIMKRVKEVSQAINAL